MPLEVCASHTQLVADLAVLKSDVSYIRTAIDAEQKVMNQHIYDADKEGGWHYRIIIGEQRDRQLAQQISEIKKSYWKIGAITGIVSGLLVRVAPESLGLLFATLWKVISKSG